MKALQYSQARNNLRKIIDEACNDFNEFIITTKENQSAVLISYDEYAAMKESLYLLSSKTNRDRLLESIDEIENSKFVLKEIKE